MRGEDFFRLFTYLSECVGLRGLRASESRWESFRPRFFLQEWRSHGLALLLLHVVTQGGPGKIRDRQSATSIRRCLARRFGNISLPFCLCWMLSLLLSTLISPLHEPL